MFLCCSMRIICWTCICCSTCVGKYIDQNGTLSISYLPLFIPSHRGSGQFNFYSSQFRKFHIFRIEDNWNWPQPCFTLSMSIHAFQLKTSFTNARFDKKKEKVYFISNELLPWSNHVIFVSLLSIWATIEKVCTEIDETPLWNQLSTPPDRRVWEDQSCLFTDKESSLNLFFTFFFLSLLSSSNSFGLKLVFFPPPGFNETC